MIRNRQLSARRASASHQLPPRVSVVMAVHNRERFLPESVESVLAQTYPNWELLLVDDGSTDESLAIARRYAATHPTQIRCLTHAGNANRGAGASRNLAIRHALGEYVAVLDSDDIAEPHRLHRQVAFLDAHPETALVGTWYMEIDPAGRILGRYPKPSDPVGIRWALLFYCPFVHSSVMFRRERVVESVGGYDETLRTSQDFEFWTRIVPRWPTANLAEHLVRLRVHPESLTAQQGIQAQLGHRMRIRQVAELLGWSDRAFAVQQQRFSAMSSLLHGSAAGCRHCDLLDAVADLLHLHTVFCRRSRLSKSDSLMLERKLRRQMAEQLAVFAMGAPRPGETVKLLRLAARIAPAGLLRPRTVRRSAARLFRTLFGGRGSGRSTAGQSAGPL